MGRSAGESDMDDAAIPAATGLQDYDKAKSSTGSCISCWKKILKGHDRFSYRFKVSDKFGDQLRVHANPQCMTGLSQGTRKTDIWFCKAAQMFTDDENDKLMLEAARVALVKSTQNEYAAYAF